MAIRLSEVFVEIGAKTAKFNSAIGKADSRLAKFGGRLSSFAKENQFALAAVGTAGVLAFKGIVTAAGDFDASMRRVSAVSGATAKEFKKLTETAKELGATTQFSASQAASGMEFLAKAGFDTNEVLQAIPGTLQLAAAASLDLGSAADIVTNVLTGFGLEVRELTRVNDVLVKTFTSSNTNLLELGESMKIAGSTAAAAGLDFEETVAILGKLGDAGLKGSIGGTTLRRAIVNLIKPNNEAKRTLDKLGVSIKDSSGQMRSMVDILGDLEAASITAEQSIAIFGVRAGPAVQGLINRGVESIRELATELKDSAGTAARIAAVQMEGFNGAIKRLISVFEALQIAIASSGLLEFAKKLVEGLTGLLSVIGSLPNEVLALAAAMAGLVTVVSGLGAIMVTLGGFLGAIKIAFIGTAAAATVAAPAIAGTGSAFAFAAVGATKFSVSLAVLAGPIGLIAIAAAGLAAVFFKLRSEIREANKAQEEFANNTKNQSDRISEGIAIGREFENVTIKQAKAMKFGAVEAEKLSRAIRGLRTAQATGRETSQTEDLFKKEIANLEALRKVALANAGIIKKIQIERSAFSISLAEFEAARKNTLEEQKTNKLIEQELIRRTTLQQSDNAKRKAEQDLAAFREQINADKVISNDAEALAEIGSAEFIAERKQEILEEQATRLIEQQLIQAINSAASDEQERIAIENLATFRKTKGLEVFDFQKKLILRTGSLLKTSFASSIVAMTKGTSSFGEAVKSITGSVTSFVLKSFIEQEIASRALAIKEIINARGVASAKAIAAEAGKGLLGIATASIAVAAFSALISRFTGFQQGGDVTGRGGIDSVPALLTPGERVLTPAQNRNFKGGGATSIVVNIFDPVVDSDDRLAELADRVGLAFMDKLLLEGRLAT